MNLRFVLLHSFLFSLLTAFTVGCGKTNYSEGLLFEDLRSSNTFSATIDRVILEDVGFGDEEDWIALVFISSADGTSYMLGSMGMADTNVVSFVKQLEVGKMYQFPEVLLDFEKNAGVQLKESDPADAHP